MHYIIMSNLLLQFIQFIHYRLLPLVFYHFIVLYICGCIYMPILTASLWIFRPPDILCWRTYILPGFLSCSFFFRQLISEPSIFSGYTTPPFLRQIVSATYRPPFGKVWLSSVCWSPSEKRGANEVECRIYGWWVKLTSNLKPFVDYYLVTKTPRLLVCVFGL